MLLSPRVVCHYTGGGRKISSLMLEILLNEVEGTKGNPFPVAELADLSEKTERSRIGPYLEKTNKQANLDPYAEC